MKNLPFFFKTLILMGFLEIVDVNVPFCDETRCYLYFLYALYCNGLHVRAIKPDRTGEKNLTYDSYPT